MSQDRSDAEHRVTNLELFFDLVFFIGGGADAINQYLAAGLVDALELHVVPIVLGGGARLFDGVGSGLRLELVRAVGAPGVTHVKYRVMR